MDVDLGVGLGDDLGGFEGFDELLSNPNQADFFKFCVLEDGVTQHDPRAPFVTTLPFSGSTDTSANQVGLEEYNATYDEWNRGQTREITKLDMTNAALMYATGKPRTRKRLEDDSSLEATEAAHPILKRRASAGPSATKKMQEFPCTNVLHSNVSGGDPSAKSTSFALEIPLDAGEKFKLAGVPPGWGLAGARPTRVRSTPRMVAPRGAIKVKREVMSVSTRPRISVFMSSTAARSGTKKHGGLSVTSLDGNPRASTLPRLSSPVMRDNHGPSPQASPRVPNAAPKRIKGLRVVVPRSRSQAEQRVVDSNPPVVAMGSRRSTSSSDGVHAVPRLHRASSVGALTIAGSGDVVSRSQILSPTGSIIQSCELSEQLAGRSQRRNLVFKVFGSGSRTSRPTSGPH